MNQLCLPFAMIAVGVTAVIAQSDPIAARKALMKANNDNARNLVKMMRGETPYDAAKVNAAFAQWAETAAEVPGLFPDNSKTGGNTRATPKIRETRSDFEAKVAAFGKAVADNRDKARISTRSRSPWPPWVRPATAATSNIAPGSADCFNRLVLAVAPPGAAALSCLQRGRRGSLQPTAIRFYAIYERNVGTAYWGFGSLFFINIIRADWLYMTLRPLDHWRAPGRHWRLGNCDVAARHWRAAGPHRLRPHHVLVHLFAFLQSCARQHFLRDHGSMVVVPCLVVAHPDLNFSLYAAATTHLSSACGRLPALTLSLHAAEISQIVLGFSVPLLLASHFGVVRVAGVVFGRDPNQYATPLFAYWGQGRT